MANETLHLYITDAEQFIQGNRSWCLTVYELPPEAAPESWVYVHPIEVNCDIARDILVQHAQAKINEERDLEMATHHEKMERYEERKQKLLAIPHLGEQDD